MVKPKLRNNLDEHRGSSLEFKMTNVPNDGCSSNEINIITYDISRWGNENVNQ